MKTEGNGLSYFRGLGLIAPPSFWSTTPSQRSVICNGAGANGGIQFPNTFYGLDMTIAFDIHDWAYEDGVSVRDKQEADAAMFLNLNMLITAGTTKVPAIGRFLRWVRRYRATSYYNAVVEFGSNAFFANK